MTVRRYTEVYQLIGDCVNERVFVQSGQDNKDFRTVSHVLLQRRRDLAAAQGDGPPQLLVVSNMHVVSGQKHHKIPGKNPRRKTAFKVRVVTNGIEKAVQFAERQHAALAAAQGERIGFVAAGDYNLHKEATKEALENVQCDGGVVESLSLHCVNDEQLLPRQGGKQRDFIVCSHRCDVDLRGLPIAHDQQHRAVGIQMLGPIEPFEAEHAADADIAEERARMQKEQGRAATLAAMQGEEPQGEEPSVAAASGSASASAPLPAPAVTGLQPPPAHPAVPPAPSEPRRLRPPRSRRRRWPGSTRRCRRLPGRCRRRSRRRRGSWRCCPSTSRRLRRRSRPTELFSIVTGFVLSASLCCSAPLQ